jgi:rare lipoprotein A
LSCVSRGRSSSAGIGTYVTLRLLALALTAATLAGCAQAPLVRERTASVSASRQAAEPTRRTPVVFRKPAVVATKKDVATVSKDAAEPRDATYGLASFYRYDSMTASGEKFNPNELTAAHRTLPFGTRVRVTNLTTGKSVTVRINDRGPFIAGRVVDVSYSAAETLGMVGQGVAKVKLDVVQ